MGGNVAKKPRKISKIKEELDTIAKTLAKIRDNYTCQKCDKAVEGTNCHGSHVIPVSAGNKLRWDLNNIKTLCYHDHINVWHKNPLEAAEWFKAKFPERDEYLEENKGIRQFKRWELEEMLIEYRAKLKEVKK